MAEMQGNVPQGTNTLQNPDCVISTNHPSAKVSMTWPRPMSQGWGKDLPLEWEMTESCGEGVEVEG